IGSWKVGEIVQVIDVAGGRHLGKADAADAEPADLEAIGFAAVAQCAAPKIAPADEGDLHLLDPYRAGFLQIFRHGVASHAQSLQRSDQEHGERWRSRPGRAAGARTSSR